jgi:hypothetical protein
VGYLSSDEGHDTQAMPRSTKSARHVMATAIGIISMTRRHDDIRYDGRQHDVDKNSGDVDEETIN